MVVWEVVERHERPGGGVHLSAWVALPLSVFLAFASIPFLAVSVYPPLERFITQRGRVEADLREVDGRLSLSIFFPHTMKKTGLNLTLDSRAVPAEYADAVGREGGAALIRWESFQTLWLDLDAILNDLDLKRPGTLGVNTLPNAPKFTYQSGDPVPPQQVPIE